MRRSKTYDLFTDYSQFWLHDAGADVTQVAELWSNAASDSMLAVGSDIICVGTIRNSHAPVTIEVVDAEPLSAPDDTWDQIVECSLQMPVGKLVIHDDILGEEGSHQTVSVTPGCYRVRIYFGSLDAQHTALKGDDHYLVVLWLGDEIAPRVLKKWRPKASGTRP